MNNEVAAMVLAMWGGMSQSPIKTKLKRAKRKVIDCRLPECKSSTDHKSGFCSVMCRPYFMSKLWWKLKLIELEEWYKL